MGDRRIHGRMSVKYPEHQSTGYALNEADACRKFVVPKLQAAGWDDDPRSIAEQRYFTDGLIIDHGGQAKGRSGKMIVAFQICWKLWSSKWNAKNDPTRKPPVSNLADCDILLEQPIDKEFNVFGGTVHTCRRDAVLSFAVSSPNNRRFGQVGEFCR